MLSANELIVLEPQERGKAILSHVDNWTEIKDEIEKASQISTIINSFIDSYIQIKINEDESRKDGSVLQTNNLNVAIQTEIDAFLPQAMIELENAMPTLEQLLASFKNIYELSGARKLSYANRVTRNLSTTMGSLWERIANISPCAISPELEFNVQIKGIDLIAKNKQTAKIEYIQLKTQKNTLTGSQKERTIKELSIHDNPVFCACFETKQNWTFTSEKIPRAVGEEFWGRIGISYAIVVDHVKQLVLELENQYIKLLNEPN